MYPSIYYFICPQIWFLIWLQYINIYFHVMHTNSNIYSLNERIYYDVWILPMTWIPFVFNYEHIHSIWTRLTFQNLKSIIDILKIQIKNKYFLLHKLLNQSNPLRVVDEACSISCQQLQLWFSNTYYNDYIITLLEQKAGESKSKKRPLRVTFAIN